MLAVVTSIIPGPSNFLTMRVGMRRGRGPALATAFGTTLGCLIWCRMGGELHALALETSAPS